MQTGVRLQAHPTTEQRIALSRWMGCARVVWNAKCDEHEYFRACARKYHPIGTYAPVDQTYSQFKDDVLTPWLSECPSQVLRNAAVGWYRTMRNAIAGGCGWPRRKRKGGRASVHLTRELFRFETGEDGVRRLFLGTKTNDLGELSLNVHQAFVIPNSIRVVMDTDSRIADLSSEIRCRLDLENASGDQLVDLSDRDIV